MNGNYPNLPGHVLWRQKLMRQELNDNDQRLIEQRLELPLYGYRKPEESIVGFRVLYESEEEDHADLLLMRRDFTEWGFFFDLDVTLGRVDEDQSAWLYGQVEQTIATLSDQDPTVYQEPMGS
jgi:hypothetical protein